MDEQNGEHSQSLGPTNGPGESHEEDSNSLQAGSTAPPIPAHDRLSVAEMSESSSEKNSSEDGKLEVNGSASPSKRRPAPLDLDRPAPHDMERSASNPSMKDVPLDSPSEQDNVRPPLPIKAPMAPITPRSSTPHSQAATPRTSMSTTATSKTHIRSLTLSHGHTVSSVLVTTALDTILQSKEARKSAALKDATQRALDMFDTANPGLFDPRVLFEPLRLACETRNEKLMIASLDCIQKLISYSFFSEAAASQQQPPYASPPTSPQSASQMSEMPLPDVIAHTITSAYSEATPDAVALQIVKALLSLVLSNSVVVHHSSLLKAVRTIYNVFLLSTNPSNQLVAQGGLTQIINHVFARCQVGGKHTPARSSDSLHSKSSPAPSRRESLATSAEAVPLPPMTPSESETVVELQSEKTTSPKENGDSSHTNGETPVKRPITLETLQTMNPDEDLADTDPNAPPRHMSFNDLFFKDAYLVFRALSKLSMKSLVTESERDLKSHGMRSKLLSLHLLLAILTNYMPVFTDPSSMLYSGSSGEATQFLDATKQYLCLSLSRNAISSVPQVFELSVDMFYRVVVGMRSRLKKEIEVLLNEIFIPLLEIKTSTLHQKAVLLQLLSRLSQDAQTLVDLYINYDCDSEALENIYEKLMNIVSKISSTQPSAAAQKGASSDVTSPVVERGAKLGSKNVPPSLSTSAMGVPGDGSVLASSEITLRRQALECLVTALRALVAWGTTADKGGVVLPSKKSESTANLNGGVGSQSHPSMERLSLSGSFPHDSRVSTPDINDDPSRFESAKQKKTLLLEGIRKFNFKPKKGIKFLAENGFIPSTSASDVAHFLMSTEGLSKAMIGEYLGEGDEDNVATMHAFVDILDFTDLLFTESLRNFLQCFRLPGEAQKIDRFMLKFAERYIACNPQTVFKNAESAYVLGYSVIMLNTDAHNPQVKNRMTKADFIRNNRGINDGTDLPEDLLSAIYQEIQINEIRMKDEVEQDALMSLSSSTPGLAGTLANVGRDYLKEAYVMQTSGILSRTEAMFKTVSRSKGTAPQFFSASHFHHVRPMFEVAWMSFLAGLSAPLQDTNDLEIVELCLDGFKSSIHIVCFFDLDLQRTSFVTTLAKFTFLNNLGEMKTKNMEAIKTLLDVAVNEGNQLKGCWRDVLTCVSQLERMQLIGSSKDAVDSKRSRAKLPAEELANESRSTHITVAADMVFSLSHYLSGSAIVDFVQALSDISWEEIQSSGMSETPRMFSLQKLVEISYYNMNRIRLEWANMWAILGEHFNQICCHTNPHVAFFALDALRQLAMRFLEKEELPHFKFQKDFLRPFQYTMIHNPHTDARDMVLQCLQQMIQSKVENMRSGWRTMFAVFSAASRINNERIATTAFEIVTRLNKSHFEAIVRNGAFADMTVCITDFCKANRFQKISLLAIGMLRGVIPMMLKSPECVISAQPPIEATPSQSGDDLTLRFWFPVLFSFYDIIMNGEDLEVRQMALDSLFSTLKTYGPTFSPEFWDNISRELLFPIFAVLKNAADVSRFSTQEDMSVWFSTTMVEALRNLIDLYTHHFELIERSFGGLLELLSTCICQENDTIARIGTSCFQKLLENNVQKLTKSQWEQVTSTFVALFKMTTPHQLFDETLRVEYHDSPDMPTTPKEPSTSAILPSPLPPEMPVKSDAPNPTQARRKIFQQIIVKCVLQLLLIETTGELLQNKAIYETMPPDQLLRWMSVLDHSYQFARSFNDDKELRTGLWRVGFMKHLPNLLKQESSSAATLVKVLLRMYYDTRPGHQVSRPQVADRLMPLGSGIMRDFNKLRPETNMKSITAWSPVVASLIQGFCGFDDQTFNGYLTAVYPLIVDLLSRELQPEMRPAVQAFFKRVGHVQAIL